MDKASEEQSIENAIDRIEHDLSNLDELFNRFDLGYVSALTRLFTKIDRRVQSRAIALELTERYAHTLHRMVTFLEKRLEVLSQEDEQKRSQYQNAPRIWQTSSQKVEDILWQFHLRSKEELLAVPHVRTILNAIVKAHDQGLEISLEDLSHPDQGIELKAPNLARILNSLVSMGLVAEDLVHDNGQRTLLTPGNWLVRSDLTI
ncbi:MAG: hypothetical protein C9356_19380 [Oleiphilus sp.]|nr:MAG: hypothetical protein C9356_19380 [Oleiphilus sp.]